MRKFESFIYKFILFWAGGYTLINLERLVPTNTYDASWVNIAIAIFVAVFFGSKLKLKSY